MVKFNEAVAFVAGPLQSPEMSKIACPQNRDPRLVLILLLRQDCWRLLWAALGCLVMTLTTIGAETEVLAETSSVLI